MAVPQRVVSHDKTALPKHREGHFVGFDIRSLVAINENKVEGDAQAWGFGDGVADGEAYFVGHGTTLYPRAGEVFLLVVNLEGVQNTVIW